MKKSCDPMHDITNMDQDTAKIDNCAKAKNAFISNISHEIRTPMNAIMGFAQMLQSTELNAKQADYVDVILESGNKLLTIIKNLLDLSNLQIRRMTLHPVDCSLNQLIEGIWQHHRPRIAAKNLNPVLEIENNLPIARLDREKLERVLNYILSNAIKFTESGSVFLRVKLLQTSHGESCLDIEVEDTGCGIETDQLELVFEAFEQGDNSETRAYPGMGLGLRISSMLVELMGGEIGVCSRPSEGSCFHLTLPVDIY